jgi:hypothetical protein
MSPITNDTYMLNTELLNAIDAEQQCRLAGGHLTSYHSAEEQQDVEMYFMHEGACSSSNTSKRSQSVSHQLISMPSHYARAGTGRSGAARMQEADAWCMQPPQSLPLLACSQALRPCCSTHDQSARLHIQQVHHIIIPTTTTCHNSPLPSTLAGYLVPPYHGNYWLGLNTTSYEWPQFYWLDHSPPLGPLTYNNWGTLALADGAGFLPEPNNVYPPEYCVTANYSMMSGEGTWGWQDTNCTIGQFPFICKMTRERPAAIDACCASELHVSCQRCTADDPVACSVA